MKAPRVPATAEARAPGCDPIASDPLSIPSSTPKTRLSSGSGETRCRSVRRRRPSRRGPSRPAPGAAAPPAAAGASPTAASAPPHSSSPAPNGPARRERPMRSAVSRAPTIPPAPMAAFRKPTPDCPIAKLVEGQDDEEHVEDAPQDRRGAEEDDDGARPLLAGEHRETGHRLGDGAAEARVLARLAVRRSRARQASRPASPPPARGRPRRRRPVPGRATCRTTPATAGPTRIAVVSMLPAATLAAVSSAGVRDSDGRMAAWTGRVSVIVELATAASDVDDRHRRMSQQAGRHGAGHRRLEQVGGQEDPLARIAIPERRRQRRDERPPAPAGGPPPAPPRRRRRGRRRRPGSRPRSPTRSG